MRFATKYLKQAEVVEEQPLSTYVPYIYDNLEWKVYYPFFSGSSNMGNDFIGNYDTTYASSELPTDAQILRKPTSFTINTPELYSATSETTGYHMRMPDIDISASNGVFFSFFIETFGSNHSRGAILDLGACRIQLFTPNGNALFIRDHLDATYYLFTIRNVKTHVGLYVNTGVIKVYINTVLTASFTPATGLTLPSSMSPSIGRAHPDNDPTWAFSSTRMAINDFRMYFGEPSQADVNKLYNLELYLRCHYTFEKYFNNSVIYDSYKYHNGTMFGNSITTLDKKTGNYSAYFSGDVNNIVVTNYIKYNNNIDIDMSRFTGCSFSIWMKFTDTLQNLASKVFDFFADTGSKNLYLYNFSDTDKTLFKFGASSNAGFRFNMPVDQWNHLVITIGASNAMKIYVNNVLTINVTYDSSILPTSKLDKGGVISKSLNTGENISQWNGHIDDFKIYNKVLTSDDINILYNE